MPRTAKAGGTASTPVPPAPATEQVASTGSVTLNKDGTPRKKRGPKPGTKRGRPAGSKNKTATTTRTSAKSGETQTNYQVYVKSADNQLVYLGAAVGSGGADACTNGVNSGALKYEPHFEYVPVPVGVLTNPVRLSMQAVVLNGSTPTTTVKKPAAAASTGKRRGRPPKSATVPVSASSAASTTEPPKRRGRPPGSKNKTAVKSAAPKVSAEQQVATQTSELPPNPFA